MPKEGRPGDENYDPKILYLPSDFLKSLSDGQKQWWEFKSKHMDEVMFFKRISFSAGASLELTLAIFSQAFKLRTSNAEANSLLSNTVSQRDRLLLHIGTPCFRGFGRRKSVMGCIVSPDLSVLNLVIVKKGENDLSGLTDIKKPRMRGPKRASKIRKLFNLSKEDDVSKYVNTYRKTFTTKTGKKVSKAPKIQRLVTPLTLQRKRVRIADWKKRIAKANAEAAEYQKLLVSHLKEQRERCSESLAMRRSKL
ncbi:hypothetical protein K1719_030137 [Acacia pycnantha]|nr:hypothetical protein K1719_030137 [Acacia pycnantha]